MSARTRTDKTDRHTPRTHTRTQAHTKACTHARTHTCTHAKRTHSRKHRQTGRNTTHTVVEHACAHAHTYTRARFVLTTLAVEVCGSSCCESRSLNQKSELGSEASSPVTTKRSHPHKHKIEQPHLVSGQECLRAPSTLPIFLISFCKFRLG